MFTAALTNLDDYFAPEFVKHNITYRKVVIFE